MFFWLNCRGKWSCKVLKLYEESWPTFEQISKKVPTPRTLEPPAFDEWSTFDTSVFKCSVNRGSLYTAFGEGVGTSNVDYSSTAKGSNLLDYLLNIGTVLTQLCLFSCGTRHTFATRTIPGYMIATASARISLDNSKNSNTAVDTITVKLSKTKLGTLRLL
jgi:hypothetical protein